MENTLQKLIIYTKNIKNNDVFNVLNMSGFNLTFFEENEDAEEESGSESADEGPPEKSQKTAKKVYAQQFRHQWLEDPEFKDWLVRPRPGENACSCKLCNKSVLCRKTALRRHTQSAQHKRALSEIAAGQRQGNLVECLQRQNEITTYKETTEARMCSFLAQHNLPLSLINNLMSLFKSVAPKNGKEVEILKGIHLSSTRCTNIIRQGVGLYFQMEVFMIVMNQLNVCHLSFSTQVEPNVHKTRQKQLKHKFHVLPSSLTNISKNSPKISPKNAIPQIAPQKSANFPVLGKFPQK